MSVDGGDWVGDETAALALAEIAGASAHLPVADTPPSLIDAFAGLVGASPLLRVLDSDLARHVMASGRWIKRPAGARLLAEGQHGSSLYVLLRGRVAVERMIAGSRRFVAALGPGSFFGELAALTGVPRSASVRAIEDVGVLEIGAELLRDLIAGAPAVREVLMRYVRARLIGTLLATSPLFIGLPRERLLDLVQRFRMRHLDPDAMLVEPGAPVDGLGVVMNGGLEVAHAAAGARQVIDRLGPGDAFDETWLPADALVPVGVRAVESTWLLILPHAAVAELVAAEPQFVVRLAGMVRSQRGGRLGPR